MNRSNYGSWVDAPNLKVYPVEMYAHNEAIIELAKQRNETPEVIERLQDDLTETYHYAFDRGLIRVVHMPRERIGIQGRASDIARAHTILLSTCLQPDVDIVYVDPVEEERKDRTDNKNSKQFQLPNDRIPLMMFIRGEK